MRHPLVALLMLALAAAAHADDAPPPPRAVLEAAERVFDAGKVDRGVTVRHTFLVKNVSAEALSIDAKPG